jgi:ubiquinone/menaquinone biosynthesis C-methylase UbiE
MRSTGERGSGDAGYVPAAGRAPLALYDPVVALVMRERTFRGRLLEQVLADGPAVVADVGCGTGTFALALARAAGRGDGRGGRAGTIVAIDGDPAALARARAKAGDDAVDWRAGLADALPLGDGSVDRVVLSLVLHHLSPATQQAALHEAQRVLRPGGRVHVADWGPPRDPAMRVAFRALQLLDGVENTAPLGAGRLPELLREAGFGDVRLHDRLRTGAGVLELRSAVRE